MLNLVTAGGVTHEPVTVPSVFEVSAVTTVGPVLAGAGGLPEGGVATRDGLEGLAGPLRKLVPFTGAMPATQK